MRGPPVEQVVMQLSIPSAELLFIQEEGVIKESESVKDIKIVLFQGELDQKLWNRHGGLKQDANLLGYNECIVY